MEEAKKAQRENDRHGAKTREKQPGIHLMENARVVSNSVSMMICVSPLPLQPEMGQNLLLSTGAVRNKTCPLAVLKPFSHQAKILVWIICMEMYKKLGS